MSNPPLSFDRNNVQFLRAMDIALVKRESLFLTGGAGTGKTHFLKCLSQILHKKEINHAVVAPTGIAALNAGGQTIHSFFKVPISIFPPDDKRLRTKVPANDYDRTSIYDTFRYATSRKNIIKALDVLIIDEISMVRADLLDVVDRLLRVFRGRERYADKDLGESLPFGGCQVIMIGDPFQLPPIIQEGDRDILFRTYNNGWFFASSAFRDIQNTVELKKVYRQEDEAFQNLLNRIRDNSYSDDDLTTLHSRYNATFENSEESNKYITITTTNNAALNYNRRKLDSLTGREKFFHGKSSGRFFEHDLPVEKVLILKVGARVMLVKNGPGYVNGDLGEVVALSDDKISISLDRGGVILVDKAKWENKEYVWNEKEKKIHEHVIGSYIQYPLKLAWSITVHKSQGLTFNYVVADLARAFTEGQVYVALSRCPSLAGLVLQTRIPRSAISADEDVIDFYKQVVHNK